MSIVEEEHETITWIEVNQTGNGSFYTVTRPTRGWHTV